MKTETTATETAIETIENIETINTKQQSFVDAVTAITIPFLEGYKNLEKLPFKFSLKGDYVIIGSTENAISSLKYCNLQTILTESKDFQRSNEIKIFLLQDEYYGETTNFWGIIPNNWKEIIESKLCEESQKLKEKLKTEYKQ